MQDLMKNFGILRAEARGANWENFRSKFNEFTSKLATKEDWYDFTGQDGYGAMGIVLEDGWTVICEFGNWPYEFVAQRGFDVLVYVEGDVTIYSLSHLKTLVTA